MIINQRQSERKIATLNATYKRINSGKHEIFRAITKNVSDKGACVVSNDAFELGEEVAVNMAFQDPTIRFIPITGKIAWVKKWEDADNSLKYMMGIQFIDIKDSYKQAFLDYMTRLIGRVESETTDTDDVMGEHLKNRIGSTKKSFPVQMTHLIKPPVKIAAIATYLPEKVISNQDLVNSGLNTSAKTIKRALGAVDRRVTQSNETNAEMMASVGRQLLDKAGIDASQIDRIICSADPQDTVVPNTAVVVQRLLDARCPSFDVQMSCVGWLCGLELASRCISTGEEKILVLASCTIGSRVFFYNSTHRAIFGDGAGGVLVERDSTASQVLSMGLWSDGRYNDKIFIPYSWTKMPESIPDEYKNSFFMSPTQDDFFATMDFNLVPFCKNLWDDAGIQKNDIDYFLLHQPSMPLFEHSVKALDVPREKCLDYYASFGNLVGAEIPVYINQAIEDGKISSGDLVFALTYGAGFTMGGMVIRI